MTSESTVDAGAPGGRRRPRSRRRAGAGPPRPIPWAPLVGVLMLTVLVYGATVPSFPVAGPSAVLLDKHLWLDGLPPATHAVWGMVTRGLAARVSGSPVAVLNGFSLLCGLVAIGCFYRLQFWLLETVQPRRQTYIYVLGAVSATLFLAVSPPVWLVSTRAHPFSFDLALFLVALCLLVEYHRWSALPALYGFGFLYGIGCLEYPPFVAFAWPLGLITLYLMRRRKHLRRRNKRPLFIGLGFVCAGGLLVVPICLQLMRSPATAWMTDVSALRMLRYLLAAQWRQCLAAWPRTGWLLIGMVSVVPWVVCLVETRRRSSLRHLPSLLMYVVLTGIPLAALVNAPIAPFAVMGDDRPIVLPYLFIASTFGLLVNYWHAAVTRFWRKQLAERRPWLRNLLVGALPACVVAGPLATLPVVSARPARVLYDCAHEILDALDGRPWLVTDGTLDSLVRLAALERGIHVELFSIPDGFRPRYQRMIQSRFGNPRYRSLAELGLLPLLRELLRTDPDIHEKLAFQNSGNAWLDSGWEAVPEKLVYLGAPPGASPRDADAVLDKHYAFWQSVVPRLWNTEQLGGSRGELAQHLRWQISRVANDLGVSFARAGDDENARRAYRAARTANDVNASAIANLAAAGEGDLPPEVRSELNLPVPVLVQRHGHVHKLANLLAVRGDESPVTTSVMPDEIKQRFMEFSSHYQSGDLLRCLAALDEILTQDPDQPVAWYLRGLLAALSGDDRLWKRCYAFMEKQDSPWPAYLMIQGDRLIRSGDVSAGLGLHRTAAEVSPFDIRIIRPVAFSEFVYGDRDRARRYVTRLLSLDPSDGWGNFALGTMQFERDEIELAESSLRTALLKLDIPHAHNNLAWLLALKGEFDEALRLVDRALALDAEFVPAWDTRGYIRMQQGDLDGARDALETALGLHASDWDSRVHLSRLDLETGRTDAARARIRAMEPEAANRPVATLREYRALRDDLGLPPLVRSGAGVD